MKCHTSTEQNTALRFKYRWFIGLHSLIRSRINQNKRRSKTRSQKFQPCVLRGNEIQAVHKIIKYRDKWFGPGERSELIRERSIWLITTRMATMDSLTQQFSSSKWPMSKQRQRTAREREIGTTSWCDKFLAASHI